MTKFQAQLDAYKKTKREWEKERDQLKKENDGLKAENSRLLAKVYPEVFGTLTGALATNKNGNFGREFYRCRKKKDRACKFFIWEDELEAHGWPGYLEDDDNDLALNIDFHAPEAGPAPPSTPPTSSPNLPNASPAITNEDKKRPADGEPARESLQVKKPRTAPIKLEKKETKVQEDKLKQEERVGEVKEEDPFKLRRSKRVSIKPKKFDEWSWTE
ncbi:zinc finger, GRF-type protein [Rhodotorula toruloides]|uniref:Zinc finger, GRF-type protein n=1 Tax=Rhodotorula toruloides TaxID=5286 RepID=A0A511KDR4_RHOTO|nr:zinc finger, GRF-type protein [Rhodotorula toruloides]